MLPIPDNLRDFLRPTPAWYAAIAALVLTFIGVMAIHTAEPGFGSKQLQWVPIALLVMVAVMIPHPRTISYLAYPLAGVVLVMLLILILPGVPSSFVPRVNGAKSWYDLKVMRFQPSEVAKIAFVLSLGHYLRYRDSYRTVKGLAVVFVFMLVPVALILKQPDLGTALVFGPTLLFVLVAVGAKMRHLLSLVGTAGAVVLLVLASVFIFPVDKHPLLAPYQVRRITSMVDLARGEGDVLGHAYQQNVAMNMIGSGRLTGYGAERSLVIVQFNHLPEDHNDMIFPVIVNRWGFMGGAVIIGMYLVIVLAFLDVAAKSKDPFGRVACVGFAGMILTQTTVNIGMTLGVLPITGITLPFISYGGSSLLASFAVIGLVLNFAARKPRLITRPSFEFRNADAIFQ
jgi:cell division protein FtsW (lipid II flippase)